MVCDLDLRCTLVWWFCCVADLEWLLGLIVGFWLSCGGFDFSDLNAVVLVYVWFDVLVWFEWCWCKCCVLRLWAWWERWVVVGWVVLFVIAFLDWHLVGMGDFIGL